MKDAVFGSGCGWVRPDPVARPFKEGESPAVVRKKLDQLKALKSQIFELMKQADTIASEIKEKV